MSSINDSGFVRDRYQDERQTIADSFNEYFPGKRTNVQSVNGRVISLQADLVDQTNAKIQALLDAFNPQAARGNLLFNLSPLMNKRARPAVKSTVTLTVTADANGTTIPAGSIVSPQSGPERFVTDFEVVVAPSSSATIAAAATEFGPFEAGAGTLTKIQTPVFGWQSVTNLAAASVGRSSETEAQLRFRMLQTSASPNGTPEGIFAAVTEVGGVTYASILENRTDFTDATGLLPHSVMPVVDGGSDTEVANALFGSVSAGVQYNDATSVPSANFTTVTVNNPANQRPYDVVFARPSGVPIVVAIEIETTAIFPADGVARIKVAIVDYVASWPIGKTLFSSKLYTPANTVDGVDINTLTIDGIDRVVLQPFERPTVDVASITVTVV